MVLPHLNIHLFFWERIQWFCQCCCPPSVWDRLYNQNGGQIDCRFFTTSVCFLSRASAQRSPAALQRRRGEFGTRHPSVMSAARPRQTGVSLFFSKRVCGRGLLGFSHSVLRGTHDELQPKWTSARDNREVLSKCLLHCGEREEEWVRIRTFERTIRAFQRRGEGF